VDRVAAQAGSGHVDTRTHNPSSVARLSDCAVTNP
jgi:hypothetical protein